MALLIKSLGVRVLSACEQAGDMLVLFLQSLRESRWAPAKAHRIFVQMKRIGNDTLPIAAAMAVFTGMVLALLSGYALRRYGTEQLLATIVALSLVKQMVPVLTGLLLSGRIGAAIAAEIGTMQVNEEIDALRTLGISPMEFLVLPRMLAMALMMPLLCLYSDLMGILGGLVVGVTMLDLSPVVYFNQTRAAVSLNHFWVGLFHSVVFGVLVALAGCLRGMQCGRSASAVGDAATSAVVTGIVSIIVATAIITVVFNVIGI